MVLEGGIDGTDALWSRRDSVDVVMTSQQHLSLLETFLDHFQGAVLPERHERASLLAPTGVFPQARRRGSTEHADKRKNSAPPSTFNRPSNMAAREIWSKTLTPSMEVTVACGFCSHRPCKTWATHSHPARVDNACW